MRQWQLKESVFKNLLFFIYFLNTLDTGFSARYFFFVADISLEVNPLVRWVMGHGLFEFILFKMVVVMIGLRTLWRLRDHFAAHLATALILIVYVSVAGTFLFNLGAVLY